MQVINQKMPVIDRIEQIINSRSSIDPPKTAKNLNFKYFLVWKAPYKIFQNTFNAIRNRNSKKLSNKIQKIRRRWWERNKPSAAKCFLIVSYFSYAKPHTWLLNTLKVVVQRNTFKVYYHKCYQNLFNWGTLTTSV